MSCCECFFLNIFTSVFLYIFNVYIFKKSFFSSVLSMVVPEDRSPFVTVQNKTEVEKAMFSAVDHVKMRMRKRKEEEESYRIVREATFSWKTEAVFRKDPVFEDDDDMETQWWQKPELSKEKKQVKLRLAEREVKFQMANRRRLQQSFSSKPYSSLQLHGSSSDSQFDQLLPYTKPDTRRCHGCQGLGHIFRFCPHRSQSQFQQPQSQPQQQLQSGYQSKFKSSSGDKLDGN